MIGNYALSEEEAKVQMAIWSIMASPLIMSTDLKDIKPHFKAILQNEDVIAINQDALGIPGNQIDPSVSSPQFLICIQKKLFVG